MAIARSIASRSSWLTPATWPEDLLFDGPRTIPSYTKTLLSRKQLKHPYPEFFLSSQRYNSISIILSLIKDFSTTLVDYRSHFCPYMRLHPIFFLRLLAIHTHELQRYPWLIINMVPPPVRPSLLFFLPSLLLPFNNLTAFNVESIYSPTPQTHKVKSQRSGMHHESRDSGKAKLCSEINIHNSSGFMNTESVGNNFCLWSTSFSLRSEPSFKEKFWEWALWGSQSSKVTHQIRTLLQDEDCCHISVSKKSRFSKKFSRMSPVFFTLPG